MSKSCRIDFLSDRGIDRKMQSVYAFYNGEPEIIVPLLKKFLKHSKESIAGMKESEGIDMLSTAMTPMNFIFFDVGLFNGKLPKSGEKVSRFGLVGEEEPDGSVGEDYIYIFRLDEMESRKVGGVRIDIMEALYDKEGKIEGREILGSVFPEGRCKI